MFSDFLPTQNHFCFVQMKSKVKIVCGVWKTAINFTPWLLSVPHHLCLRFETLRQCHGCQAWSESRPMIGKLGPKTSLIGWLNHFQSVPGPQELFASTTKKSHPYKQIIHTVGLALQKNFLLDKISLPHLLWEWSTIKWSFPPDPDEFSGRRLALLWLVS